MIMKQREPSFFTTQCQRCGGFSLAVANMGGLPRWRVALMALQVGWHALWARRE